MPQATFASAVLSRVRSQIDERDPGLVARLHRLQDGFEIDVHAHDAGHALGNHVVDLVVLLDRITLRGANDQVHAEVLSRIVDALLDAEPEGIVQVVQGDTDAHLSRLVCRHAVIGSNAMRQHTSSAIPNFFILFLLFSDISTSRRKLFPFYEQSRGQASFSSNRQISSMVANGPFSSWSKGAASSVFIQSSHL